MPKSEKPRTKRPAKRTRKGLIRFDPERIAEVLNLTAPLSEIPPKSLRQFSEVAESHGDILHRSTKILDGLSLDIPRVLVFIPNNLNGTWELESVKSAYTVLGSRTYAHICGELANFAKEKGRPDAVAALLFGMPSSKSTPFSAMTLCADAAGVAALGISLDGRFKFFESDFEILRMLVETELSLWKGLDEDHFARLSARLLKDIEYEGEGARVAATQLSAVLPPEFLEEWLRSTTRSHADWDASMTHELLVRIDCALADHMRQILQERHEREEALGKAHAKQIKSLSRQLEKSALLSKGAQERAQRLATEVRKLKSQLGRASAPDAMDAEAGSLPEALDQLFS